MFICQICCVVFLLVQLYVEQFVVWVRIRAVVPSIFVRVALTFRLAQRLALYNATQVLGDKQDFTELQSALQLALKVYGKLASIAELRRTKAQESNHQEPEDTAGIQLAITTFEEFFVSFAANHIIPHFTADRAVSVSASDAISLAPSPSIPLAGDDHERIRAYALACVLLSNLQRHLAPESVAARSGTHELPAWYNTLLVCAQLPCPQLAAESVTVWSQLMRQPTAGIPPAMYQFILNQTEYVACIWCSDVLQID
jgi:hypothetical protein